MHIEKVTVNGKEYRLFTDVVLFPNTIDEVVIDHIAEEALELEIQKMIEADQYHRVRIIDELYGYYVPQVVADNENEDEIRESIEDVYDIDEWDRVEKIDELLQNAGCTYLSKNCGNMLSAWFDNDENCGFVRYLDDTIKSVTELTGDEMKLLWAELK